MTYVINKYDGTTLVAIPDRTLNTTATSIKLPGRDYPRYGEPVVEDIVWMLENFAGASAPSTPMQGQIWYDTNSSSIKVYNGAGTWLGTGKVSYGATAPDLPEAGQIWYDNSRKQTFIYDNNSASWELIGPVGASSGNDGVVPVSSRTTIDATKIVDTASPTPGSHDALRLTIGSSILAIISKDSLYNTALSGFASIGPGINLNTTLGLKFVGTATNADVATNALNLNGTNSSLFYRKDQSNIPTSSGLTLGSSGSRFSTVYATTFDGTATSALYADLAERYETDTHVEPGTVVSLSGDREISPSKNRGCTDVLGVISTNPAFAMNNQAGIDDTHPLVALVGRVPVKVKGNVSKFERIMASEEPGVACAWDGVDMLAIVGRSLVNKTSDDVEIIEAVVGQR